MWILELRGGIIIKIFYFSATGNSLDVAEQIGGDLYSIPQVLKRSQVEFKAEKIGIIFPCHFFGTPEIVKNFIDQVELESDYIFAIMTYGNMSFSGVDQFKRLASKAGIELNYTNQLSMVDNYLPLYDIADELEGKSRAEIDENLEQIINDLQKNKESLLQQRFWEKILTFSAQLVYKIRRGKIDKNFSVTDDCTACKICEQICPVDNIEVKEQPNYNHHCEECLACVHSCPEQAIKLKKAKGTKHFKNRNVDLKELIEANK
ncbi:MAG: EFR1 family ferrodoxin [Bacillota bacterium]